MITPPKREKTEKKAKNGDFCYFDGLSGVQEYIFSRNHIDIRNQRKKLNLDRPSKPKISNLHFHGPGPSYRVDCLCGLYGLRTGPLILKKLKINPETESAAPIIL